MSDENRSPSADAVPAPAAQVIERRLVERRGAGLFRQFLLFVAGLLVGANGVYYWLQRDAARDAVAPATRTALPAPNRTPAAPTPADAVPATIVVDPHGSEPPRGVAPPQAATAGPAGLVVPVQGIAATQLLDTFTQARGESRVHDAIDIMAPHGTPVLAAADGTIAKLFESKAGGTTLYQFDPSGRFVYYYAHLQGYAPGIVEGKALRRGEVIGFVGATGNASPDGPHLHFAIGELSAEKKWWDYTAINPYPLLGGR